MNSRRPTTAWIDQLSLNLRVTRSPDTSVLVSVLPRSPGTLGGGAAGVILLCLAGCLEAVGGTAQYGGLALPVLGGLCDGGSLLTVVMGTSVGGGADGGVDVRLGAVPDGPGLVLEAPPPAGPLSVVPGRARLLGGCAGAYPSRGRLMRFRPALLYSSSSLLMTSSCSSGAFSGSWPVTMYRCVRKLM